MQTTLTRIFIALKSVSHGFPENQGSISEKSRNFKHFTCPKLGDLQKKTYGAVDPRVIFSTKKILPAVHKDVLPTTQQSMIVYQYVCHCDCRYVGRTTQRLQDRINQHIPKSIRTGHQQQKFQPQRNCKKTSTEINCDSAVGQHLLQNKTCANNFNTNQFSILAKARTQFHLSTLEATLIRILKPELCRQKEFVYSLQLIH